MISIHYMLCMPVVCILSTSLYNTSHATYVVVCILSTSLYNTSHATYAHCVHT
ncbi:hypothetical protein HanIR_Chr09g0407721 [Helianthus annuus]|nr:hypothetical protein HanIR_Chr09g0407721 [Helianthus annuus]